MEFPVSRPRLDRTTLRESGGTSATAAAGLEQVLVPQGNLLGGADTGGGRQTCGRGGAGDVCIEALRHAKSGRCFTEAYRRENWTVRPTCPPRKDQFARKLEQRDTSAPCNLRWTEGATPEAVIQQALGFLGLRCKR